MKTVLALALVLGAVSSPVITTKVFLDISLDSRPAQRVVIGLYGNILPKTTENFRALCTGENGYDSYGHKLHYKNTTFFSVASGLMIIGGDITHSHVGESVSIYGREFPDEGYTVKHDRPGLVGMFTLSPNTNGSIFYITVAQYQRMDGRRVVFGEVLEGMEIVGEIDYMGLRDPSPGDRVVIENSGEL